MTRDSRGRFTSGNNVNENSNNGGNNMNTNNNGVNNFSVEELAAALLAKMATPQATQTDSVSNQVEVKKDGWAVNSQFYGKELVSGYIYNPYLDRRFLPSRYLQMMKNSKNDNFNVNTEIRRKYDSKYMIKFLKKEMNKLTMLEKRDRLAFQERKHFFSLRSVSKIVIEYIDMCLGYINSYIAIPDEKMLCRKDRKVYMNINGIGYTYIGVWDKVVNPQNDNNTIVRITPSDDIKYIIHSLEEFERRVKWCYSYSDMANLLNGFRFIILPESYSLPRTFVEEFKKSGAYFTIKYLIMFEGLSFKGHTGIDAYHKLNTFLSSDGFVIHACLKEMIADNNYRL